MTWLLSAQNPICRIAREFSQRIAHFMESEWMWYKTWVLRPNCTRSLISEMKAHHTSFLSWAGCVKASANGWGLRHNGQRHRKTTNWNSFGGSGRSAWLVHSGQMGYEPRTFPQGPHWTAFPCHLESIALVHCSVRKCLNESNGIVLNPLDRSPA